MLKYWNELQEFRNERRRCKNYTFGRQWDDYIYVDGRRMREEDYIRMQGNIPLKNNLIRRIVRNIVGLWRNHYGLPTLADLGIEESAVNINRYKELRRRATANDFTELFSRTMEEFLISGMAVVKRWDGLNNGRRGVWTSPVMPDSFFFNTDMKDPRGWDVNTVGELHETDFETLCARFGGDDETRGRLARIYGEGEQNCRVIECWRREHAGYWRVHDRRTGRVFRSESRPADDGSGALRSRRVSFDRWRYSYCSPEGEVLAEGLSPYPDGSHPYVFKLYPYIDGEIHSFVADCIDQQRYVNRLVTLHDWIMRSSAKGVLLFPEYALPEGADINEVCDEWSRFNGVIVYRPKSGMPGPEQVSTRSTDIGIAELLEVQLKMMEDVSGVNSALQGKIESGATSGTLYSMQTRQAMNGLVDILDCYRAFVTDWCRKIF